MAEHAPVLSKPDQAVGGAWMVVATCPCGWQHRVGWSDPVEATLRAQEMAAAHERAGIAPAETGGQRGGTTTKAYVEPWWLRGDRFTWVFIGVVVISTTLAFFAWVLWSSNAKPDDGTYECSGGLPNYRWVVRVNDGQLISARWAGPETFEQRMDTMYLGDRRGSGFEARINGITQSCKPR